MRSAEVAVKNARVAIDGVRRLLSFYSEEHIDESSFDAAIQAMDLALAELKKQSQVIKDSEQYQAEYRDSYTVAALGRQEDMFDVIRPIPSKDRGVRTLQG